MVIDAARLMKRVHGFQESGRGPVVNGIGKPSPQGIPAGASARGGPHLPPSSSGTSSDVHSHLSIPSETTRLPGPSQAHLPGPSHSQPPPPPSHIPPERYMDSRRSMIEFSPLGRLANGFPVNSLHQTSRLEEHFIDMQHRNSPPRMGLPLLHPVNHSSRHSAPPHPHPPQGRREDEESSYNYAQSSADDLVKYSSLEEALQKNPFVRDTLNTLATCVPFQIRLKKDHMMVGRMFAFDASFRAPHDLELKYFVEFPIGSGTVHNCISSLVRLMCHDMVKDFAKGQSSGLVYLDYEVKHNSGHWSSISDLFTDGVQHFKEALKRELLPTPFIDSCLPPLPSHLGRVVPILKPDSHRSYPEGGSSSSSRKRKSSPGTDDEHRGHTSKLADEHHKRQQWLQNQADALKLTISSASTAFGTGLPSSTSISPLSNHNHTPSPPGGNHQSSDPVPSPVVGLMNISHTLSAPTGHPDPHYTTSLMRVPHHSPNGSRRSGHIGPVSDTGVGSTMPESTSGHSADLLKCTLCQERLEDTHFVQCPSVADHKFCFPCSKESIKRQGAGSEVYCPSGGKCPLVGSSVPWAFMQGEIMTILGEDYNRPGTSNTTSGDNSVSDTSKDVSIKKERDS